MIGKPAVTAGFVKIGKPALGVSQGEGVFNWQGYWTTQYQAVLDAMVVKPSSFDKTRQARLMKRLVDEGYYAKAELLDMFSMDTSANSLFNLKDPTSFNPSLVNAPSHKPYQGFRGNTADGTIRMNYVPSVNKDLIAQNDICVLIGVGEDRLDAQDNFGAAPAADANRLSIRAMHSDNKAYFRCNGATAGNVSVTDSIKYFGMSRNSAATFDRYLNKTMVSVTAASQGLSDIELYACGLNSNGTIIPNLSLLRFVFIFKYLTPLEYIRLIDIMEEYFRDYHTNLINYNEHIVKSYPLTTAIIALTTYDGGGETCHPSVVNIGSVWNSYQYWMANTPFPGSDSNYENPSIWASLDGETWVVPVGLTNPIVAAPGVGFNADTDIYYDSASDKLYVIWKADSATTKMISSSDGVTWGDTKTILTTITGETECISPSLIKIGNKYYIYYYTYDTVVTTNPRTFRVSCDTIDGTYGGRETISLPAETGYIWWHFDIIFANGFYWLSALQTVGSNGGPWIFIMRSSDAIHFYKGVYPTVSITNNKTVSLNLVGLYRPSLALIGTQHVLYFATYSSANKWGLAKMNVDLLTNDTAVGPDGDPSDLILTPVSYNEIDLAWTNGSTNEEILYIKRSTDGVNFTTKNYVLNGIAVYNDTDSIVNDTRYYYEVYAFRNGILSLAATGNALSGSLPAAQNLLKWSEALDNDIWIKSAATILADQEYDLDGNLTLDKITTTNNSAYIRYADGTNYIDVTPGVTYRFSFEAKRGTMSKMYYVVYDITHSVNIIAWTDYYPLISDTVPTRVSQEFTAPVGCIKVSVYLVRDSGVTGTVFVGRIQVEENGSLYAKTEGAIIP